MIALQRAVGNAAASRLLSGMSLASIVQPVIGSAGVPLDPLARGLMEARLGADFRDVRVHTDNQAAASARAVGALAYAVNRHLVFGAGRYAPGTASGRELLAHELSHVVQSRGSTAALRLGRADDAWEREAEHAASSGPAGLRRPISTGAPALVRRVVDPQLAQYLRALESAAKDQEVAPRATEEVVATLIALLRGLKIADPDNLTPVTTTVAENFSPDVLTGFLVAIESRVPHRKTAEQQRYEQTLRRLEPRRHGPYGIVGPGLFLPVMAGAMEPAVAPLMNAVGSGAAFFIGLFEGLGETVSQEDADRLNFQIMKASILSTVFPVVFVAGTVVGIVQDVWNVLKLVYHVAVGDLGEWLATGKEVVTLMLKPEGAELAAAVGREIGRGFGAQIIEMSHSNVFKVSFELGRLVGPTIVYTILAFIGFPEAIGAAIGERLLLILGPLLQNEPRLLALVTRLAARMGHVPRTPVATAGETVPASTAVATAADALPDRAAAAAAAENFPGTTAAAAGAEKLPGTAAAAEKLPGPTTVEEYVARGGKITEGKPAPLPEPEPIKIKTIEERFEARKSDILGEEAEVEAIHPTKNPFGREERAYFQRGKFAHAFADKLGTIMKQLLAKGDAKAAEMVEKIGLKWPKGIPPNTKYAVTLKDGSTRIPDGIDWEEGILYELKPRNVEQIAKGEEQLANYVRYMNQYEPRKGTPWRGELLTYDADVLTELLEKWGHLKPKKPKTPKPPKTSKKP